MTLPKYSEYFYSMIQKRTKDTNKSNEAIKHLIGKELTSQECDELFYILINQLCNLTIVEKSEKIKEIKNERNIR